MLDTPVTPTEAPTETPAEQVIAWATQTVETKRRAEAEQAEAARLEREAKAKAATAARWERFKVLVPEIVHPFIHLYADSIALQIPGVELITVETYEAMPARRNHAATPDQVFYKTIEDIRQEMIHTSLEQAICDARRIQPEPQPEVRYVLERDQDDPMMGVIVEISPDNPKNGVVIARTLDMGRRPQQMVIYANQGWQNP